VTDSLSWLREPDVHHALSDVLSGLIRDVRRIIVHPDLGNAAKLAAIADSVDFLAAPPGLEGDSVRTAVRLAALIAGNTGPMTLLLEEVAGEQARIELASSVDRELTAAERRELRAGAGARGYHRSGALRLQSGLVAAEVSSVVIPGRLPACAREKLGMLGDAASAPSGIPLGKVLAGLGASREPLGTRLAREPAGLPAGCGSSGRVTVESSARMWLADVPVALASERITAEFCQRFGDRWTRDAT
jgi:hypothetical protein